VSDLDIWEATTLTKIGDNGQSCRSRQCEIQSTSSRRTPVTHRQHLQTNDIPMSITRSTTTTTAKPEVRGKGRILIPTESKPLNRSREKWQNRLRLFTGNSEQMDNIQHFYRPNFIGDSQVRSRNGFWRLIARKTRNRARMCLCGLQKLQSCHIVHESWHTVTYRKQQKILKDDVTWAVRWYWRGATQVTSPSWCVNLCVSSWSK